MHRFPFLRWVVPWQGCVCRTQKQKRNTHRNQGHPPRAGTASAARANGTPTVAGNQKQGRRPGWVHNGLTLPRSQLIDRENGGWHHVVSRCVRRAWLLGRDSRSGLDFSHRRAWMEERMLMLSEVFTVRVYGYAVMSNHVHLALEYRPRDALALTDGEVAGRWLPRPGAPSIWRRRSRR